jgi:hypothetical protein
MAVLAGRAHAITRTFLDGHIAQVHARPAARARDKITDQQLERAWTNRIQPAGPAGKITIAHHEIAASGGLAFLPFPS